MGSSKRDKYIGEPKYGDDQLLFSSSSSFLFSFFIKKMKGEKEEREHVPSRRNGEDF